MSALSTKTIQDNNIKFSIKYVGSRPVDKQGFRWERCEIQHPITPRSIVGHIELKSLVVKVDNVGTETIQALVESQVNVPESISKAFRHYENWLTCGAMGCLCTLSGVIFLVVALTGEKNYLGVGIAFTGIGLVCSMSFFCAARSFSKGKRELEDLTRSAIDKCLLDAKEKTDQPLSMKITASKQEMFSNPFLTSV